MLIVKLVSIFADVKERTEEKDERLALMQKKLGTRGNALVNPITTRVDED